MSLNTNAEKNDLNSLNFSIPEKKIENILKVEEELKAFKFDKNYFLFLILLRNTTWLFAQNGQIFYIRTVIEKEQQTQLYNYGLKQLRIIYFYLKKDLE